jgi:beta-glucanase (GH16 family)
MKKTLLLAAILSISSLFFSSCSNNGGASSIIQDDVDRHGFTKLKWSDEFDGDSLSLDSWSYQHGTGSDYGLTDWGNGEAEFYTEDNVEVKDGKLVITAVKEEMRGKNYTSGRIRTAGKVSTKYGRIEARISLPEVTGMWPAFWMLPETNTYGSWPYSGEIDIMEARGRVTDMTSSAIHYGGPGDVYKSSTHVIRDKEDSISSYHVYAVEWTKEKITCFVDDDEVMSMKRGTWWSGSVDLETNYDAPFDVEFYIILNLAVGGHFDGYNLPPEDFTEASMFVDYVRIYEMEESE